MTQTDIDTRLLRFFLVLAEEENVTRAAVRLYITQQGLSRQLRRLEDLVGGQLFARTYDGLVLTEFGRALVPPARAVLNAAQQFAVVAQGGRLPLRIPELRGPDTMPLVLHRFNLKSPRTPIHIGGYTGMNQLSALREGQLDVAMSRKVALDDSFRYEFFKLDPVVLVTLEEPPQALKLADLRIGVPETQFEGWSGFCEALASSMGCPSFLSLPVEVTAGHGLRYCLMNGDVDAVLILAAMRDYISNVDLWFSAPSDVQAYYVWYAVWLNASGRNDAVAKLFVESVREVSAELGWDRPDPSLPGRPWFAPGDEVPDLPPYG